MKTIGQVAFIILVVVWVSTGAINPLKMAGDVLSFINGGFSAAEQRLPTPQ